MSELKIRNTRQSTFWAGIIFVVIVFSAYLPVLLLDQTFQINTPISSEYLTNQNKDTLFGIVADYGMMGLWPDIKLSSKMILEVELPLWNPYVAIGYPLGADTTDHIFSPISLGFLLPVEFWDLPLLAILWVAGFSMFLFLRNLGLNFSSSLCGGIFYMFSGTFTWFMSHPGPFVMMVTPLILFSMDKVIKNNNPKYIVLLSLSFAFSILGAHLQSLFLQFLLIILYFVYRLCFTFLFFKIPGELISLRQKLNKISKSSFKIFLGLLGGLSLTSFFIFYVFEFLQNGILENSLHYDTIQYNTLSIANTFIPYILGDLTRTWTTNTEWISPFGYLGIFVLFFSIISLHYLKHKSYLERFTPIFFLIIASLSLMRLANSPIISSVHSLPFFDLISFGSYSGVLISFGFSVAAAFGINYLSRDIISKKSLFITLMISLGIIFVTLVPVLTEFFTSQQLSNFIDKTDIQNYIIFKIAQALIFLSFVFILSLVLIKKTNLIIILPFFVLLEMLLYLPFGLHPIDLAYKFGLILITMISLTLIIKFFRKNNSKNNKIFWFTVMMMMIGTILGILVISENSPYGMPTRQDYFEDNSITDFLQDNLGHHRMFSFETTMRSDYNVGFNISSIGQHSSFLVNDYYTFSKQFLDKEQSPLGLGSTPWSNLYGPEKSIDKFLENKKYFDFLGVKYIITQGYDLNSVSYGVSGLSGNHLILDSQEQKIEQTFISTTNSIDSLGIFLFGLNFEDEDEIILTVDSIPYNEEDHRSLERTKITNSALNEFQLSPPIINSLDKKFKFSLQYPNANIEKYLVMYYDDKNSSYVNMELFVNDELKNEKILPFVITPVEQDFPIPFNFHDIFINENLDAFPRAYLVHDYVLVPNDTAQNYLFKNSNFDLKHSVILESSQVELNNLLPTMYNTDKIEIIEFNENKIRINSFSESDSILILTDAYYPGWQVLIDEKPSEILRANGLVRAIILEEGSHIIEFNYVPESFWNGVIISIITTISLFVVYVYSKKYHKIGIS